MVLSKASNKVIQSIRAMALEFTVVSGLFFLIMRSYKMLMNVAVAGEFNSLAF